MHNLDGACESLATSYECLDGNTYGTWPLTLEVPPRCVLSDKTAPATPHGRCKHVCFLLA